MAATHKNIATLQGIVIDGDETEKYWFVLEYFDKKCLRTVLNAEFSALDWKIKTKIARDVAAGMSFLHTKNVIHRDLKGQNVLLRDDYSAAVADFGLAKMKRETMATQTFGGVLGTPHFIAPEIFEGKKATYASDVYSFAIVLFELADGGTPFPEIDNLYAIAAVVCRGNRPAIPKDTPPFVASVMKSAWDPRPELRPSFDEIGLSFNMDRGSMILNIPKIESGLSPVDSANDGSSAQTTVTVQRPAQVPDPATLRVKAKADFAKKGSKKESSGFFGQETAETEKKGKLDKTMIDTPTNTRQVGQDSQLSHMNPKEPPEWKTLNQKAENDEYPLQGKKPGKKID
ncbi:hypothetical protein HDU91_003433, partial [Kappamyces sp. JEL0680]